MNSNASINNPEQIEAIQSAWKEIRLHLENLRKAINQEIQSYPAPITGCDQQFNYLLEKRTNLSLEIKKLNQAAHEGQIDAIQEFIKNSNFINDQVEKKANAQLIGMLSAEK